MKTKCRNDLTDGTIGACWETLKNNFSIFDHEPATNEPSESEPGGRGSTLFIYLFIYFILAFEIDRQAANPLSTPEYIKMTPHPWK